ncbi:STAS domain-containing protein [Streptomyces sp. NPDC055189]
MHSQGRRGTRDQSQDEGPAKLHKRRARLAVSDCGLSGERRRLILDLSALTHCDNGGLFTLLGICQALDTAGIEVDIARTGPAADTAIEHAGLQDRLPLRPL